MIMLTSKRPAKLTGSVTRKAPYRAPVVPPKPRAAWNGFTFGLAVATSVIALGFGQACVGGNSGGGGGARAEGPVGIAHAADTSAAVGAVLAGKVVTPAADANQQIPGTVAGSAAVDDAGGATYRVPLWVPDGVNGMQPSLDVIYSSHGGRGLFGRRWSLGGLSSIRRCAKTLAIDGDKRPVDFSGDTFCLDGQRLVRTSGSWNDLGTFQTRANPFSKIVASAVDDQGVSTFKVYEPGGRILTYAYHPESRLRGTPMGSQSVVTYAYYVDKIEDRYGNTILITYSDPSSEADAEHEELVPTRITWGATGDNVGLRSAEFVYWPALEADPGHEAWVHGLGVFAGNLISSIVLRGPDGAGNVGILKQYNFTYDSVTISGEWLLTSISECDGNNICKYPTQINWEPGTWGFSSNDLTALGVDDVNLTTSLTRTDGVATPDVYRRILTADMNHDGLDDIVYRRLKEAPPPGQEQRLEWYMRLSTGTSFGPAVSLNTTSNAPRSEQAHYTDGFHDDDTLPGTSDLILADLDGDDLTDILVPTSYVNENGPTFERFQPEMNLSGAGFSYVDFLDFGILGPPFADSVSVADIDGDGLPEVVRPSNYGSSGLLAFRVTKAGSTPVQIPGDSPQMQDLPMTAFSAIDLDGDGVAEVLRQVPGGEVVASRTMSGTVPLPQVTLGSSVRWPMDLNGDGLTDLVYVQAADTTTLLVYFNTGAGFAPPKATSLPPSAAIGQAFTVGMDAGVRIADVNLDGRDDMVLVNDGGTPARRTVFVLLSDGMGNFQVVDTSQPIGDSTNGYLSPIDAATLRITHANAHGFRTSAVLDVNGDGLPDLLQLEGGELVLRTRQGNPPDVVTSIVEGSQRTTTIAYSSPNDPTVYGADPSLCSDAQLSCFVRGTSLVNNVTISGGSISRTQWFRYAGGVSDRGGLGFLGFERSEIYGVGSEHITKTYDPTTRAVVGSGYTYPNALVPQTIRSQLNTATSTNSHRRSDRTMSPDFHLVFDANSNAIGYVLLPQSIADDMYDCPPIPYPGTTGGPDNASFATCDPAMLRHLGSVSRTLDHDAFGNTTNDSRQFFDSDGSWMRTDTEATTYSYDTDNWLVQELSQQVTSSQTHTESVSRTLDFTPDPTTGVVASFEVEKAANDPATHMRRTLWHDSRGRLGLIDDYDYATNMDRTLGFAYEDADGVYVTTTYDSAGFSTRTWRHDGLGYVVQVDDPNGASTTSQYDTLGRLLAQSAPTGASTTYVYPLNAPAGGGLSLSVVPSGSATKQLTIDPFGHTTSVTMSVDSSRRLVEGWGYDAFGRLQGTTLTSAAMTTAKDTISTVLESHRFTYDDAGRVVSDCHDVPAGSHGGAIFAAGVRCATTSYDGLIATTTDEANRTSTVVYDGMGRVQREQSPSMAEAEFSYGPFGLLEGEWTPDGSTVITFDDLGRTRTVSRTGAGVLGTDYNALGDVVGTYKVNSTDGSHAEVLTYERDSLGRLTHLSGTSSYPPGPGFPAAIDRTYSWDFDSTGDNVNTLERLVDVIDNASQTTVHFDYSQAGQILGKSWSVFNSQDLGPDPVTPPELYSVGYTYDAQGRTTTMTYPSRPGASPLTIRYAYDAFSGAQSAVYNVANDSVPLWQVASVDARGNITSESMQLPPTVPGGTPSAAVTRSASYFLENGQRQTATLAGTGGSAQLTYAYQEDGLPDQLAMTTSSASWTSSFDYDDLARLTSWTPDLNAPTVSYGYDSAGNLTSRTWSNETVTYGTNDVGRTVTTTRDGGAAVVDSYATDAFGRITDTPAVTFRMTSDDKIGAVVEKATGSVDTILYDPLGHRILTLFGEDPASGAGSLVTLDDLYELHRSALTGYSETCRVKANGRLVGDFACRGDAPPTYHLLDNVGSVLATASSNGVVTVAARRDPYGSLVPTASQPYLAPDPESSVPTAQRYGMFDHSRDGEWGTIDMNARAYSPRLGRFLSADPIIARPLDRRDHNPFSYVRNSPTALTDPTGMTPSAAGIISSFVAANTVNVNVDDPAAGLESVSPGGPLLSVDSSGELALQRSGLESLPDDVPGGSVTNADSPADGGNTAEVQPNGNICVFPPGLKPPMPLGSDPQPPPSEPPNAPYSRMGYIYTPNGGYAPGGNYSPNPTQPRSPTRVTVGAGGTVSIQAGVGVSVTAAFVGDGDKQGLALTINPKAGWGIGGGVDPTVLVCRGGVDDITSWSVTGEVDAVAVSVSGSASGTSQCAAVSGGGLSLAVGGSEGVSYTVVIPLPPPPSPTWDPWGHMGR